MTVGKQCDFHPLYDIVQNCQVDTHLSCCNDFFSVKIITFKTLHLTCAFAHPKERKALSTKPLVQLIMDGGVKRLNLYFFSKQINKELKNIKTMNENLF